MINELKNVLLTTGYFIDNEYLAAYLALVTNKALDKTKGYKEKHHIIPAAVYRYTNKLKNGVEARQFANADKNNYVVTLLYKDHVLAHYLLCFCTKNKVKYAMVQAVVCMQGNFSIEPFDTKVFKYLPEQFTCLQNIIDTLFADPNNNFYTQYEIDFLKQYYVEKGPEFCAKELNRPIGSIRSKAHRLHLKQGKYKSWTDDELAILKQYYVQYGPDYCVNILKNRSYSAITSHARALGLQTDHLWSASDLAFLVENYSKIGGKQCAKALKRAYSAVRNKASQLNLEAAKLTRHSANTWSEKEVQLLTENASRGAKYCASLIGRAPHSIASKASKSGIKINQPNIWTEKEISFLKENYAQFGLDFCAKALARRSKSSIRVKASTLGLAVNNTWKDFEVNFLIKNYGKGVAYCANQLDKKPSAIRAKAHLLGLTTKKPGPWSAEEINFLIKNY